MTKAYYKSAKKTNMENIKPKKIKANSKNV